MAIVFSLRFFVSSLFLDNDLIWKPQITFRDAIRNVPACGSDAPRVQGVRTGFRRILVRTLRVYWVSEPAGEWVGRSALTGGACAGGVSEPPPRSGEWFGRAAAASIRTAPRGPTVG